VWETESRRLKALKDNNISLNEGIILRTDSEEDLNNRIQEISR
jgi:LacI family transcriptional regulator